MPQFIYFDYSLDLAADLLDHPAQTLDLLGHPVQILDLLGYPDQNPALLDRPVLLVPTALALVRPMAGEAADPSPTMADEAAASPMAVAAANPTVAAGIRLDPEE